MDTPQHPLVFEPVPVPRPWGGRRCCELGLLDVEPPSGDQPIGEWWLISAREDTPSRVSQGPEQGRSLAALLAHDPRRVLGPELDRWDRFPLLLKVLDAAENLSVQVHPSDALVPGEGKTESWYVLDAAPGASLYLGLADGAALQQMFRAAESGDPAAARSLGVTPARAGDLAHLPAGLVHALGAGVVALEVQQNSDTTYRIYDWDRQPRRELHLNAAERVSAPVQEAPRPAPELVQESPFRRERLVDCEAYVLERIEVRGEIELETGAEFHLLCSLGAPCTLRSVGPAVILPRGHAALVPGATGPYRVRADAPTTLFRAIPR